MGGTASKECTGANVDLEETLKGISCPFREVFVWGGENGSYCIQSDGVGGENGGATRGGEEV